MKKLKDSYKIKLRCATCGCDDHFESNEDNSYIKCTFCNREYFGGIDKLTELNQDVINEVQEKIEKDAADYIEEELAKAFKGFKLK